MFQKLKLRLAVQFTLLSMATFLLLSTLGLWLFYGGLTEVLDDELKEVIAIARKVVEYDGERPFLRTYPTDFRLIRLHLVVQLFDQGRKLSGNYGAPGGNRLYENLTELTWQGVSYRVLARPISRDGKQLGYVQVGVPTQDRDFAVRELFEAALFVCPFLVAALFGCGYWFATRAVRPVQQSYNLQKRFLSDAGHELKTPLSVMQACLDNLDEELKADTNAQPRIEKVQRARQRMERLVGDLLLLTKTEQSTNPLVTENFSVDMLLREILGDFDELYAEKGVALHADHIENANMNGNRYLLFTVFSNLLRNALIYTDSGGTVNLSCQRDNQQVIIKVADTGVGISEEDRSRLFERFFRADESRDRKQGGSGLGLAIVKAVVDKHNGQIAVESALGKGSTFTVRLPIAGEA